MAHTTSQEFTQKLDSSDTQRRASASQTLSRGLRILEILAEKRTHLTIDEVATELGVHRSVAYRLLTTLEDHRLLTRDAAGRIALGPRMTVLAAGVAPDLQTIALPELTAVANDLSMTCFLAVLDGDECVTLSSAVPRHAVATIAQDPGACHPVTVGAPGKAILSQLTPERWPAGISDQLRADVAAVGNRGYATSHNEVIPTVRAVSVPLATPGFRPGALAVLHVSGTHNEADIAARLHRAAATIRLAFGD